MSDRPATREETLRFSAYIQQFYFCQRLHLPAAEKDLRKCIKKQGLFKCKSQEQKVSETKAQCKEYRAQIDSMKKTPGI